jgi:hypothetical protein
MQEAQVAPGKLVETREDAAKMLDLVDETLDQMPLTIQPTVVVALGFSAVMRRDDRLRATRNHPVDEILPGIASVGKDMLKGKPGEQLKRLSAVVALPRSQPQAQRAAQAIDGDMDFRAEPTPAAAQRLPSLVATFFGPPLRTDGPARSYCRSSHFPYPGQLQSGSTCAPIPRGHTTGQSACRHCSRFRRLRVISATAPRYGSPTARLRQSGGSRLHYPHRHAGLLSKTPAPYSIRRRLGSRLSSDDRTPSLSNVNTT